MPSGFSYRNSFDRSISSKWGAWLGFYYYNGLQKFLYFMQCRPWSDAAFDTVCQCSWDNRLKWVNFGKHFLFILFIYLFCNINSTNDTTMYHRRTDKKVTTKFWPFKAFSSNVCEVTLGRICTNNHMGICHMILLALIEHSKYSI